MLMKLKKWLACFLCATGPIYFAHGNTTVFEQLGADIDGEAAGDYSGRVSISADGSTVAIAADYNDGNGSNSGHVRIYQWSGGTWQQLGQDINGEAANDQSGRDVSISADGSTVAIGATYNGGNGSNSGHVRIYRWNAGFWQQLGADIDGETAGDQSGGSVSISADGSTVAIGATYNDRYGNNTGHVRIYQWSGSIWQQLGADIDGETAGDYSGRVSISADGAIVAIGASGNDGNGDSSGHVRIYQWSGSSWQQLGSDIDGEAAKDASGRDVSISADGSTVAIGASGNDGNGSNSGHVRIYRWNAGFWQQLGADIDGEAVGDYSGVSVSISADGSSVAIGAYYNDRNGSDSGHVRFYQWNGGFWQQLGADIDGEAAGDQSGGSIDRSGGSVSISADGSTVAIGASGNDGNGSNSGHVRVYSITTIEPVIPVIDVDGFHETSSGQNITVDASPATGSPASFTYQWYFKGFAIPSMFGGTTASYTIEGTTENDGTWRVVVTNSVGSTEASFEYRVFSDADSDGLSDYRESNITNTNPDIADTDIDGLSDFIEVNNTLTDPNNADSDNDGLLDGAEVNSHATDPLDTDSDDDGLLDGAEVNTHNTSPIDTDSDDDSLSDGAEVNTHGTNPNLNDSDTDGLSDFNEIFTNFTDPNIADSDGDGLTDGAEINTYSSNPLLTDSSGDGLSDDFVVSAGFSPSVDYTPLLSGWQSMLEDARTGSVMLEVANGSATLQLQIQRSDDLSTWTMNPNDMISVPIDMNGDNQFFRFAMPQE